MLSFLLLLLLLRDMAVCVVKRNVMRWILFISWERTRRVRGMDYWSLGTGTIVLRDEFAGF